MKQGRSVMSVTSPSRRELLAATAAAGVLSMVSPEMPEAAEGNAAIRPFSFHAPEAKLVDLRRRIAAAQWPEKETVADASQGVQLTTMQNLARYWATEYDWRKVEARLNALPQFI